VDPVLNRAPLVRRDVKGGLVGDLQKALEAGGVVRLERGAPTRVRSSFAGAASRWTAAAQP
jgi:hypothetical protein